MVSLKMNYQKRLNDLHRKGQGHLVTLKSPIHVLWVQNMYSLTLVSLSQGQVKIN